MRINTNTTTHISPHPINFSPVHMYTTIISCVPFFLLLLKTEGAAAIIQLAKAQNSTTQTKKVSVILKVIAGAHIGQRFRLEAQSATSEDIFKVGRASGKAIKERGVSLYKDKEISTSHAKIEILRGLPFLVDTRSTNGTQVNHFLLTFLIIYS